MTVLSHCMLFGAAVSALSDLSTDRIPNIVCISLLSTSWILRAFYPFAAALPGEILSGTAGSVPADLSALSFFTPSGRAFAAGVLSWAGGAAVPLLLYPLFQFRLLGAGDIKLLMALGSFLSPSASLKLLCLSFLSGALFLLLLLLRQCLLRGRRIHFSDKIHFSVPVLAAVLLLTGGELFCVS